MPRSYVRETTNRLERLIDRLDRQRTIDKHQQPAYFALVQRALREVLPNFINARPGEYWFVADVGRFDCQWTDGGRERYLMLTFDRSETSRHRFLLNPAWFETDGRGNPTGVDLAKLYDALRGWLRNGVSNRPSTQPVAWTSSSTRRPVALRGGL
jgi:hypothetical protein